YTIGDVHYVEEMGILVPAGRTEFAMDPVFGYTSSNLRHWVEEKTEGRISRHDVASVSIEEIRKGGAGRVTERLMDLADRKVCILNSAGYRDLEVFVAGLLNAESKGKRFLYRTAASFVRVRSGILPRPLLSVADLAIPETGGALIVVGSFVQKTSGQLRELLALPGMTGVEIRVESLLDDTLLNVEINRAAERVEKYLQRGAEVVVYTSRTVVTGRDAEESLSIGNRISEGLIEIIRKVSVRPRYLIAKGGVTSNDVATRGLGVRRAMVLGQILPGVPVWCLGPESRFPGLPYIVFPGNVGGPGAMADIVTALGCL
ncbi:MAG: hypothetical protein JXA35_01025, partial [Deltaproteobacteria bacterium]|nr:hypothetical protein [Deltaproteobacteria bacterium]